MKAFVTLLIAVPAMCGALVERARCNADNCARALTGSAGGPSRLASRKADCSAVQTATDFGSPVLATTTTGSVAAYTPKAVYLGVVTFGTVPAFASASCGPSSAVLSRFQSACSCAGSTTATTTAPTVTETITVPTGDPQPKQCDTASTDEVPNYCSFACPCIADNAGGANYCILDVSDNGPKCNIDNDCPRGTRCLAPTFLQDKSSGTCGTVAGYQACVNPAEEPMRKLLMARSEGTSFRRGPGNRGP